MAAKAEPNFAAPSTSTEVAIHLPKGSDVIRLTAALIAQFKGDSIKSIAVTPRSESKKRNMPINNLHLPPLTTRQLDASKLIPSIMQSASKAVGHVDTCIVGQKRPETSQGRLFNAGVGGREQAT